MKIPNLFRLFTPSRNGAGWFAVCPREHGVYLARVHRPGGRPQVAVCAFYPENEVTPSALERICRKARFSGHTLTTLLAPGEYQILLVEAPSVPAAELRTAVRWRIKDMLNYHIDDATVDVVQIPAGKYAAGRPRNIFVVAAPNAAIRRRVELFENAGLNLSVIDIPEMAQRNLAALLEQEGQALMLLSFDEAGGLLTVTAAGELYLSRRIDISLGQLRDAEQDVRARNLERVGLELQRSLDYVARQFQHLAVQRVTVAVPEGTGVERALAESVDLAVERLDLAQAMDISAVPELANGDYAAGALLPLGAALRDERRAL